MSTEFLSRAAAVQDFRRARRQAAIEAILARLSGESIDLFSYEDVRKKLRARETRTARRQDVPLNAIVGSVGRYADFTRSFLPRQEGMQERWARIEQAMVSPMGGLPPVELYKIGDAYFVMDGHHRVSVARALGVHHIEAYVKEVETKVPLSPDDTPENIIIKAEYTGFLERTELDELRPGADLLVTEPGKYRVLEEHISVHRYFMGIEREREVPYEEAVVHWYDTVYMPVVAIIRERGLLRDFPNRTETDLYVWIMEHRAVLQEALEWELDPDSVAADLAEQYSSRPERVVRRVSERVLDAVTPDELSEGPPPGRWRMERLVTRREERFFVDVLVAIAPLSSHEQDQPDRTWCALDQAIHIARQEGSRLKGLHVVPSPEDVASEPVQALKAEFARRCAEAGVLGGRLAVEVGSVARQICNRARWVDLVVLSLRYPPAPRPLDRLSSGLRTILRRCARPVLTVPQAHTPGDIADVLLAYDGSPKADEALFIALYLATAWQSSLTVLTAADKDLARETAEVVNAEARDYLRSHGVDADYLVQANGSAADTILQVADERDVDLMLMGGYGTAPVVEVVIGSTVERLLRRSRRPMLICR